MPQIPTGRLHSQLEAEGAEFLVLGHLLLHRIEATKAYTNTKSYDIVAANPAKHKAISIQVKSRWRSDANEFMISSIEADFVVLVRLNRGPNSKGKGGPISPPAYLVLNKAEALQHHKKYGDLGKIASNAFPSERWNRWDEIATALEIPLLVSDVTEKVED